MKIQSLLTELNTAWDILYERTLPSFLKPVLHDDTPASGPTRSTRLFLLFAETFLGLILALAALLAAAIFGNGRAAVIAAIAIPFFYEYLTHWNDLKAFARFLASLSSGISFSSSLFPLSGNEPPPNARVLYPGMIAFAFLARCVLIGILVYQRQFAMIALAFASSGFIHAWVSGLPQINSNVAFLPSAPSAKHDILAGGILIAVVLGLLSLAPAQTAACVLVTGLLTGYSSKLARDVVGGISSEALAILGYGTASLLMLLCVFFAL